LPPPVGVYSGLDNEASLHQVRANRTLTLTRGNAGVARSDHEGATDHLVSGETTGFAAESRKRRCCMLEGRQKLLVAATLAVGLASLAMGEPPMAGVKDGQQAQDGQARKDLFGDPLPLGALARFGTSRLCQGEAITALAFSPDGKLLASAGGRSGIRLWEVATGRSVAVLRGDVRADFRALAFSPDGKVLAGAQWRGKVSLWQVATWQKVRELAHPQTDFRAVAFAPDGKTLAVGGDHGVHLWDVAAGTESRTLQGEDGPVNAIAFSPDGKTLLSGGDSKTVRLWDVNSGREVQQFPHREGPIHTVGFSPDGRTVISGSVSDGVRVWDVAMGKQLLQLAKRHGPAAFSPDGRTLAATGPHDQVVFYDATTGKELRQARPELRNRHNVLAFSPDGKMVACGGLDGVVRLWDTASGGEEERGPGHESHVAAIAFAPDDRTLATTTLCAVHLWDTATGKELHRLRGFLPQVAFAADGKALATLSPGVEEGLSWWDITQAPRQLRRMPSRYLTQLALSPDGTKMVEASGITGVWDTATGKKLYGFTALQVDHLSLAFSPDGRLLAAVVSAERSLSVRVWDLATGKEVARLADGVLSLGDRSLALSADGRTLAFGPAARREVSLWDVPSGKEVGRWKGVGDVMAFSPDGYTLASGGLDGKVYLWEVLTGQLIYAFKGHAGGVTALGFSHGGETLASGSIDGTVLLWDVLTLPDEDPGGPRPALTHQELANLWADLAEADASKAYRAISALAAAPRDCLPMLKERLKAIPTADAQRVEKLIGELDAEDFATREAASHELERLGPAVEPALRKASQRRPSPEAGRRLEALLGLLARPVPPAECLREIRAIQVLARIVSPEAGKRLEALAQGEPSALQTRAAQRALARLGKR
jgi:WD40 repeat protein